MKMNRKIIVLIGLIAFQLGFISSGNAQNETYVIIVNAANNYSADLRKSRHTLKRLFLRDSSYWPNRIKAFPIARGKGSSQHIAFSKEILNMRQEKLDFHWTKLRQLTGEPAPREFISPLKAIKTVASKKGAFTVLSLDEASKLPPSVRILTRFTEGKSKK